MFCTKEDILEIFEEASIPKNEIDVRLTYPMRYFSKLEPDLNPENIKTIVVNIPKHEDKVKFVKPSVKWYELESIHAQLNVSPTRAAAIAKAKLKEKNRGNNRRVNAEGLQRTRKAC
jgi:hypothetical protein